MKKLTVVLLILLALGQTAFADDAKVMPMMVGRVYVAPTFSFALGEYDTDGNYKSYDGSIKLFNLGFALEYGVIDWITAAVQWVPGWTPWSDVKAGAYKLTSASPTSTGGINANGVADLFVGAKVQILGEKAPVKTSTFRFSIGPGVVVPLPGPDFSDEADKFFNSEKATLNKMDNHAFAAGARFYFDWIINEHFFVNFYNETLFYPIKQNLNKDGPNMRAFKAGAILQASQSGLVVAQAMSAALKDASGDINYQYRLTFEIEPVFSTPLAEGLNFSAGLPINYRFIPAYKYSLSGFKDAPSINKTAQELEEGLLDKLDTDPHHSLYINPNVSFFLTKTLLPLEFKLQYGIPIWGSNIPARHNLTLQVKVYFALPGRPQ